MITAKGMPRRRIGLVLYEKQGALLKVLYEKSGNYCYLKILQPYGFPVKAVAV